MKVLVLGGTGFVGTSLCEQLASRGHEVTALARNPREAEFEQEVATVRGDATDYDGIEPHFEGQDAVVQLVSLTPLFQPKGGNERHFEVHVGATENAVRAAQEHGVETFLQMSGVHASPDAETAYLRAKGEAEEVVKGSGLDWIIFRPTVLFGEGDEIRTFSKFVAPPYLTPLPGGGSQRFQLMWVDDCTSLMADALEGNTGAEAAAEAEEDTESEAEPASESADEGVAAAGDEEAVGDSDEEIDEDEEAVGGSDEEIDEDEEAVGDSDEEIDEGVEVDTTDEDEGNPHVGRVYEVGGPEVHTFAEVVELIYAAENKPVSVVPVPMPLADIGLSVLGAVGGPLGADQAKSLRKDLVVEHNDVDAFGVEPADLRTFADFLGVDEAALEFA